MYNLSLQNTYVCITCLYRTPMYLSEYITKCITCLYRTPMYLSEYITKCITCLYRTPMYVLLVSTEHLCMYYLSLQNTYVFI